MRMCVSPSLYIQNIALLCLATQMRKFYIQWITNVRSAIVHIEDLLCEGTRYICLTDIDIKVFVVYY